MRALCQILIGFGLANALCLAISGCTKPQGAYESYESAVFKGTHAAAKAPSPGNASPPANNPPSLSAPSRTNAPPDENILPPPIPPLPSNRYYGFPPRSFPYSLGPQARRGGGYERLLYEREELNEELRHAHEGFHKQLQENLNERLEREHEKLEKRRESGNPLHHESPLKERQTPLQNLQEERKELQEHLHHF